MGVTLGQWRGAVGNESLTSERKATRCLLERSGWVGWAGPRGVGLYWVGLGWMAQVGLGWAAAGRLGWRGLGCAGLGVGGLGWGGLGGTSSGLRPMGWGLLGGLGSPSLLC